MENGGVPMFLERKMAALDLADSSNAGINSGIRDEFRQIMKAVEDAEASIKKQAEENHCLRSELEKKVHELRNSKHEGMNSQTPPSIDYSDNHVYVLPQGQAASALLGTPESLSPVISSFAPISQGLMHIAEVNSRSLKQDLKLKIHGNEKEITLLRKHLVEYSAKEAQVRQEKHNLEKLIAHMLAAFSQQQQDLVDSLSRSISFRQVIAEENVHLTYALQAAEQERSAFISSLVPLLAEYSLDSSVVDAQSAVGNVKVLFRHLRENLMFSEAKLKETQYQILPRHSDMYGPNATESPFDSIGAKDGFGLLQSPQYPDGNSASPDPQVISDGEFIGNHQGVFGSRVATNLEQAQAEKYSPLATRNTTSQYMTEQLRVNHEDFPPARSSGTTTSEQVSSHDIARNSAFDDSDMEVHQDHTEPPMYHKDAGLTASWGPKISSYSTRQPSSSYSPNLPVVSEERSSFSEDEDLLPTIEGLQISGDALPGGELQAYGISKNGTTNCNFKWVRHLEDGSFNYIEGANQPQYLITADDVDSCLAIEVQPLDDRNRKGELVKVFADHQNKITCDLEMYNCISRSIDSGHAAYTVSLSIGYLDMWELAALSVKKNSYNIKSSGSNGVVVSEKYSSSTATIIPFGSPMEFIIVDSRGDEYRLRADSTEINSCRDTIVLTLRYFILQANKKKKSRKRSMFFSRN